MDLAKITKINMANDSQARAKYAMYVISGTNNGLSSKFDDKF